MKSTAIVLLGICAAVAVATDYADICAYFDPESPNDHWIQIRGRNCLTICDQESLDTLDCIDRNVKNVFALQCFVQNASK